MAVYIKSHNCIFVHIPKTGGTSIVTWLENNFEVDKKSKHCSNDTALEFWPNSEWSFAVVRNTWARLASSYTYQIQYYTNRLNLINQGKAKKPHKHFWQKDTVEHILQELDKGFEYYLTQFDNPLDLDLQTSYINGVDYILRLENIDNDFKQIQEKLNCYYALPLKNTSSKTDYRTFYNSKTKDWVAENYAEEIEKFKYRFEDI